MSRTFSMNSGSRDSLKVLATMRLQTERTPDAADRRRAHPTRLGHRPRAPMRRICRDRLQGFHHHPLHVVVPDRARRSRSRLVQQAIAAVAQKPPPPLADRTAGRAQFAGYLHVALAGGALQHDPRPQHQRLRSLGPSHPALQLLPLSLRQIWNLSRVVVRHRRSPPQGRPTIARPHLLVKHFSDGTLVGRDNMSLYSVDTQAR